MSKANVYPHGLKAAGNGFVSLATCVASRLSLRVAIGAAVGRCRVCEGGGMQPGVGD